MALLIIAVTCSALGKPQQLMSMMNQSTSHASARINNSLAYISTKLNPEEPGVVLTAESQNINSTLVETLGKSLTSGSTPSIRSTAAKSIGNIAEQYTAGSLSLCPHEPQLIKMLSAAYAQEHNPSVRKSIVRAAAVFNHPDAVTLLNKALDDPDAVVRDEALKAKFKRDRRRFAALCG